MSFLICPFIFHDEPPYSRTYPIYFSTFNIQWKSLIASFFNFWNTAFDWHIWNTRTKCTGQFLMLPYSWEVPCYPKPQWRCACQHENLQRSVGHPEDTCPHHYRQHELETHAASGPQRGWYPVGCNIIKYLNQVIILWISCSLIINQMLVCLQGQLRKWAIVAM